MKDEKKFNVSVHSIYWSSRFTRQRQDINFQILVVDAAVEKVSNKLAKWAIGEWWHVACKWFEKKGATVTLGEITEMTQSEYQKIKLK